MNDPFDHLPAAAPAEDQYVHIRIYRRPWYEWLGWLAWLLFELYVMQNAIASGLEFEQRAAFLYWLIFGVFLLAGLVTYVMRWINLIERQQSIDEDLELDGGAHKDVVRKNT